MKRENSPHQPEVGDLIRYYEVGVFWDHHDPNELVSGTVVSVQAGGVGCRRHDMLCEDIALYEDIVAVYPPVENQYFMGFD